MARSQKNDSLRRVTIRTTPEGEDAVSELLARHLGVPISSYIDAETRECKVSGYLERPAAFTAGVRREIAADLRALESLGLRLGPALIECRRLRREDWAHSWKRHFKAIEIGKSLLIKPSWSRRQPRKGQSMVVLDPGLSFGTGQHATTLFCLRQIASARLPGTHQSMLDIGTGSGILAIAAAKLGYRPVDAFDFDADAVRVARENTAANHVTGQIKLRRDDLTQLPIRGLGFDLVCANLIYDLLLSQKKRIVNRVKPGGRLVLAGILAVQFPQVRAAFQEIGLTLVSERREKEWRSGAFIKRSERARQ